MRPMQSALRTAAAGLIGNVLEWFDFAVYGYFSTEIGKQFFPTSMTADDQQLLAFAVFWLGFAARPIGGLVLGRGRRSHRAARAAHAVDRADGRRHARDRPACRPTRTIGIAAPLLLVLHAADPGLLARRRVHRLDGLHDRARVAADARHRRSSTAAGTTLGFILGSATAWLVNATLGAPSVGRVGLAHPVHRQRRVLHRSAGCCAAASTSPSKA